MDFSFRLLGTTRFLNLGECSDAATTFLFLGFFTSSIPSPIRPWLWSLPQAMFASHSWANLHGLGVRTNLQPIALVCLPDMEHSFYSPNVLGMTRWLRSRPNMLDTHHNGCPYSEPDMESLAVLYFCGQYLYFDSAWKVSHQSLVRMVE